VLKGSYDHHSAIYCLLADRLSKQRASKSGAEDRKKRRPSTIAEQPLVGLPGTENLQSLRLRTTSETDREQQLQQDAQRCPAGNPHSGQQAAATSAATAGPAAAVEVGGGGGFTGGLGQTEFHCLTCGSPILDNTTSTTACVKCARLRTRRLNFAHPVGGGGSTTTRPGVAMSPGGGAVSSSSHSGGGGLGGPWDSRDSGVSSGSSQDCGELTPTLEHGHPAFMASSAKGSGGTEATQFSKLVRKLSEVEGIDHRTLLRSMTRTSIDEGVDLEGGSCCCSSASLSSSVDGSSSSSGGATASVSCCGSCTEHHSKHNYHQQQHHSQLPGQYQQQLALNNKLQQQQPETFSTWSGQERQPDVWSLSLPSCQQQQLSATTAPAAAAAFNGGDSPAPAMSQLYRGMCRYNPLGPRAVLPTVPANAAAAAIGTAEANTFGIYPESSGAGADRGVNRSPVNFREGRRASDGLATQQGVVAFQQKLYAKEKSGGRVQLNRARREVKQLQSQLSAPPLSRLPDEDWSGGCPQLGAAGLSPASHSCCHHQAGASSAGSSSCCCTKRTVVADSPVFYPTTAVGTAAAAAAAASASGACMASRHVALQQQLLQHRLQQKRLYSLQKHQRYSLAEPLLLIGGSGSGAGCSSPSGPPTSSNSNGNGLRRSVFGGCGKPYLPADVRSFAPASSGSGGLSGGGGSGGSDFLFHPIAEDEPVPDTGHRNPPSPPPNFLEQPAWMSAQGRPGREESIGDTYVSDGSGGLDGLPRQMELGCKLTAGSSPPPP
jgi:hypothetical protein